MRVTLVAVAVCLLATGAAGEARSRYRSSRRSSQAIYFPDEFERANGAPGIPISLAKSLSEARDVGDLERLVDRPRRMRSDVQNVARSARDNIDGGVLASRFGGSRNTSENVNGEMAKSAICQPEMTTIPIKETREPNTIYWPSCTRVKRCGGCCSHELLSCQPTASRTIHVQVIRTQYERGSTSRMDYVGYETVPLEVHTACKCDCKLSASDCNQFQEYVADQCHCKCVNKEDFYKCTQNDKKLWEPSTCRCKCKMERECSTGRYFDINSCECRPLPSREDRPFSPVFGNRFYSAFENFYTSDNGPVSKDSGQSARHANPEDTNRSARRPVRPVRQRGPQRSHRYDQRARKPDN